MAIISYDDYLWKGANALDLGDSVAIKIVATRGFASDWAAYKGPSTWSDEKVAANGYKLKKEAAELLFPSFQVAGFKYRQ